MDSVDVGDWTTWVNPEEPNALYGLFHRRGYPTRVVRFMETGEVEDVSATWGAGNIPDYDQRLDIVCSKVIQYDENTFYARCHKENRDEVFSFRVGDPSCTWTLVEKLPPGLARLRGGGLALVETDD